MKRYARTVADGIGKRQAAESAKSWFKEALEPAQAALFDKAPETADTTYTEN
jgi:hypothetical protein